MDRKGLISLSGGLDSTTLLADCLGSGLWMQAVSFYYGSKHNHWENKSAKRIAQYYGIPLIEMDVSGIFAHSKSHLMDTAEQASKKIPEGHYEAESMRLTVVPGRNLIFLSILASIAESTGIGKVFLGIHSGDHAIYPDCRPDWYFAAENVVDQQTCGKVEVKAPFLYKTKDQIIKRGIHWKVPFELTRTCYKKQSIACGKCGSCQERLEAFKMNGMEDPLEYESRELFPK